MKSEEKRFVRYDVVGSIAHRRFIGHEGPMLTRHLKTLLPAPYRHRALAAFLIQFSERVISYA